MTFAATIRIDAEQGTAIAVVFVRVSRRAI